MQIFDYFFDLKNKEDPIIFELHPKVEQKNLTLGYYYEVTYKDEVQVYELRKQGSSFKRAFQYI